MKFINLNTESTCLLLGSSAFYIFFIWVFLIVFCKPFLVSFLKLQNFKNIFRISIPTFGESIFYNFFIGFIFIVVSVFFNLRNPFMFHFLLFKNFKIIFRISIPICRRSFFCNIWIRVFLTVMFIVLLLFVRKYFLVSFFTTKGVTAPLTKYPAMLGRSIQSFKYLEYQNMSCIEKFYKQRNRRVRKK